MQAAWIDAYNKETDSRKRAEILAREAAAHGTERAYEIRKELFDLRYDKKNGQEVDYFIRGYVHLQSLDRRVFLPGEKRRVRKGLDEVLADWQVERCESYGEEGRAALADELFNMTLLYIRLCEQDKMYNAVLLGLGSISQQSRAAKIALEIDRMTREIPERLGATEELKPFIKAARAALAYKLPEEAAAIG